MPDRRETLTWLLRALALGAAPRAGAGVLPAPSTPPPRIQGGDRAGGYGRDPNLLTPQIPWPLTLEAGQRAAVTRLADVFLPAEGDSPAASALGVPDFIDEWVSAPYPQQRADRAVLLGGLARLEDDAPGPIGALDPPEASALVARLHARATAGAAEDAHFFSRFRQICLIGYYTTARGVAELGYVGYRPSEHFAGPPPEVLARLGV